MGQLDRVVREEKCLDYLCEIKLSGFADSLEVANVGQESKVMARGPLFCHGNCWRWEEYRECHM